jgi:predicted DNA-binding transcriptional regulator AlpA
MGAAEKIPFELWAIDAEGVSQLTGLSPRTVLEKLACRPDFPVRVSARPATWVAGEVIAWRDANRAGLPIPRRRRRSRSSET